MLITRISPLTRQTTTLDLPVTNEQMAAYSAGKLLQNAFPNLTPAQREFIKTGYTEEDWAKMFPPEEEKDAFPQRPFGPAR